MPLRLEIVTAERVLFEGDVDGVVAPGAEGELGILPKHAALMSLLHPGELRFRQGADQQHMALTGGYIEVSGDRVTVLADAAEHLDEIDEARAHEAVERAHERIAARAEDVDLERALHSLRRARVRLDLVRRRARRGSGAPERQRGAN